jgi:hypothetical protein
LYIKPFYATYKTRVTYTLNHLELLLRPIEKVLQRKGLVYVIASSCYILSIIKSLLMLAPINNIG